MGESRLTQDPKCPEILPKQPMLRHHDVPAIINYLVIVVGYRPENCYAEQIDCRQILDFDLFCCKMSSMDK